MTQEGFEKDIQNTAARLIKLAEEKCWNKISQHLTFIVSDYNEFGENFRERRKLRNKINKYKIPVSLDRVIKELKNEYRDIYDINLYIFKALEKETIIEIQYYRKLNIESGYFEKIKDDLPMVHAKITRPRYALERGKFDINWESDGGLKHYWNIFLYELKYSRMMRVIKK